MYFLFTKKIVVKLRKFFGSPPFLPLKAGDSKEGQCDKNTLH